MIQQIANRGPLVASFKTHVASGISGEYKIKVTSTPDYPITSSTLKFLIEREGNPNYLQYEITVHQLCEGYKYSSTESEKEPLSVGDYEKLSRIVAKSNLPEHIKNKFKSGIELTLDDWCGLRC